MRQTEDACRGEGATKKAKDQDALKAIPKKLPSQGRASIEPFLKFQMPGNVTYVESNGFRQSNLLREHHFSIDPHLLVGQVKGACCAWVANYKYFVAPIYFLKKNCTSGGVLSATKREERKYTHKIRQKKIRRNFPSGEVHGWSLIL